MAWLCRSPSFKTVDKPQDYFKEQRLTCLKAKKLANSFFFCRVSVADLILSLEEKCCDAQMLQE